MEAIAIWFTNIFKKVAKQQAPSKSITIESFYFWFEAFWLRSVWPFV